MELITARTRMRPLEEGDLPGLREILQDPVAMTAYEHAFTEEEVQAWLRNQLRRYREEGGLGLLAVLDRKNGAFLGQAGLTWQSVEADRVLEIGYLFCRRHWHKGYATEAARALRAYAFETLGAGAVYSIIRDSNLASQAVARRNGMAPVRRFIKHYYNTDMPHDAWRITREEFEALPETEK